MAPWAGLPIIIEDHLAIAPVPTWPIAVQGFAAASLGWPIAALEAAAVMIRPAIRWPGWCFLTGVITFTVMR